jgi:hypothetical protein
VPFTEVEALYVCVPEVSSVTVREAEPPGPVVAVPSDFDPFPSLLERVMGSPDSGVPLWSVRLAVSVNGSPTVAVAGPASVREGSGSAAAAVTGTILTETGSLT